MKTLNQILLGLSIATFGLTNAYATLGPVSSGVILNEDNGHYYEVIDFHGTWSDYSDFATTSTYLGLQGHLATVTSTEENAWLVDTFTGSGLNKHLFGGTDQTVEGNWEWVTGEAWAYTNWAPGEPNNYNNEDYVEFWNNNGTWNDIWFAGGHHDGLVIEYENVSSVPVPAAFWLFSTGLLGFVGMRHKNAEV